MTLLCLKYFLHITSLTSSFNQKTLLKFLKNEYVGAYDFDKRKEYIDKEIIQPRCQVIAQGLIDEKFEPIGVKLQKFYDISLLEKVVK